MSNIKRNKLKFDSAFQHQSNTKLYIKKPTAHAYSTYSIALTFKYKYLSRDLIPLMCFPLTDSSSLGSLACRFSLLPLLRLSSVSYIRWFASGIRFIRWAASGGRFIRWAVSCGRFIRWAASGLRLIRWAVRQGNTTYSRLQYQAKVFTIFTRRKIN